MRRFRNRSSRRSSSATSAGAETDSGGLLVNATGGTVFFDYIGEMPPTLQAKLLRVLERNRARPVGGTDEVEIDARYVFATNRNLPSLVEEGTFRQDFFYRMTNFEIVVPALRDRLEDLPLLADYFRSLVNVDGTAPLLEQGAVRALANYPWPGNVRELQNVITHLVLTCTEAINSDDVRNLLGKKPTEGLFTPAFLRSRPLNQLLPQLEKEYFLQLHADSGGNLKSMSATLDIRLQALYKRFKMLGIRPKELKQPKYPK